MPSNTESLRRGPMRSVPHRGSAWVLLLLAVTRPAVPSVGPTRYRSCEKKRYGFYPVRGGMFIARGTKPLRRRSEERECACGLRSSWIPLLRTPLIEYFNSGYKHLTPPE